MTKYKCGHESQGMVLIQKENVILNLMEYEDWTNSTGVKGNKTECLGCYYKRTGLCGKLAMPMRNPDKLNKEEKI